MAHKLNLEMYAFQIKRVHTKDSEKVSIGEFFSNAYPGQMHPFKAFADDFLSRLKGLYKTKDNDLGGILIKSELDYQQRTLDCLIDGGITGIRQSLISSPEERKEITPDDTVGLHFFIRIWMCQSDTAYVFIQSYSLLTIRKLVEEVLYTLLASKGHAIINRHMQKTTTRKRMEAFLESSIPIAVSVISKPSEFDPAQTQTTSAKLVLKGKLSMDDIADTKSIQDFARNHHGISLDETNNVYRYTITYKTQNERGDFEERTVPLEVDLGDIKLIPNIVIPPICINEDNYPDFEKMRKFCDAEIRQILEEIQTD